MRKFVKSKHKGEWYSESNDYFSWVIFVTFCQCFRSQEFRSRLTCLDVQHQDFKVVYNFVVLVQCLSRLGLESQPSSGFGQTIMTSSYFTLIFRAERRVTLTFYEFIFALHCFSFWNVTIYKNFLSWKYFIWICPRIKCFLWSCSLVDQNKISTWKCNEENACVNGMWQLDGNREKPQTFLNDCL